MYTKKIQLSDMWDVALYIVIENTVANPIDAAHGGKLGVDTIEHIMAFLCSDKAVYFG